MLYDPKWEQKTKEPSLAGMVAWLETQDPEKEYMWVGKEPCLIEQYCHTLGLTDDEIHKQREDGYAVYDRLTTEERIAITRPHTFGAALERARAALAKDARPSGYWRYSVDD